MKFTQILTMLWLTLSWTLMAPVSQADPLPDPTDDYVNDFAGIIDTYHQESLRRKLTDLETQTGIELVVVTIDSLKPYKETYKNKVGQPLILFAKSLFNQWGVGQLPDNDGVMLLVVAQDKKVRIQVGSGYRQRINSDMKQIIDTALIPEFRAERYSRGIVEGVDGIIDSITEQADHVAFGLNGTELALLIGGLILLVSGIGMVTKGSPKAGWIMLLSGVGMLLMVFLSSRSEDHYSEGFGGGSTNENDGASGSWGDDD